MTIITTLDGFISFPNHPAMVNLFFSPTDHQLVIHLPMTDTEVPIPVYSEDVRVLKQVVKQQTMLNGATYDEGGYGTIYIRMQEKNAPLTPQLVNGLLDAFVEAGVVEKTDLGAMKASMVPASPKEMLTRFKTAIQELVSQLNPNRVEQAYFEIHRCYGPGQGS